MNNLILYCLFFFLFSVGLAEKNKSYELDTGYDEIDDNITLEKKPLLILPFIETKHQSLANKVLTILSDEAMSLERFEIIDRNDINTILEEQKLQLSGIVNNNLIVEIGELAAAEEALTLEITHFGQKGVPKKEEDEDEEDNDDTIFKWLVKTTVKEALKNAKRKDTLSWENNIHTEFRGTIKLINIKTGILEHSFNLSGNHTGGNRDISLTKVLGQISLQLRNRLKELYMLTSEIIEIENNNINILSGKNLGIKKGIMFEVSSDNRIKSYKGEKITLPGKTKGLIKITDVGINGSSAKIVRKWGKIKVGQKAYELKNTPLTTELNLTYANAKRYELAVKVWLDYLNSLAGSINGYIGSINDSRDDMNGYFGFGTDISYNLFSGFGTRTNLALTIPVLLAWKSDDEGHNVASVFSDPSIDASIAIQISKTRDIVFTLSYIFTKLHGPWQWQRDTGDDDDNGDNITETERAIWDDGIKPTLEAGGIYFSVSIRKLNF